MSLEGRPTPAAPGDDVPPELCVVVPTLNERDNVRPLVRELAAALGGIAWEVIFVDDDSPDGTARAVHEIDVERARVRCLERIGRRGLATACIEGMLASSAPYLAVMDGDLQHDPQILPRMLELLRSGAAELVVASRYAEGGSTALWDSKRRTFSRIATHLAGALAPAGLRDPLSGYFALRRTLLDEVAGDLSARGFKILLDILASARRPLAFREVPYRFRARRAGVSKLDSVVAWEYLLLLAGKLAGRWVPRRFRAASTRAPRRP